MRSVMKIVRFVLVVAVIAVLTHVALHGSYHRGQIAALIRSGGDEPINTDYIMWLRS